MTVIVTADSFHNEINSPNSIAYGHLTQEQKQQLIQTVENAKAGYAGGAVAPAAFPAFEMPSYNYGRPESNQTARLERGSRMYGFTGGGRINPLGTAIPIIYGEHRANVTRVNSWLFNDGEKNYLYWLGVVCQGEIEDIHSIEVNGNPIANFQNMEYGWTTGANNQTVIKHFNDQHQLRNISIPLLEGMETIFTSLINTLEAIELHIQFDAGLYVFNTRNGSVTNNSVKIKVYYRINGTSTWDVFKEWTITAKQKNEFARTLRIEGLDPNRYDFRVVNETPERTSETHLYFQSVFFGQIDEIRTDDIAYVNRALVWIKALATEDLRGDDPDITCVVKGIKVNAPDVRDVDNSIVPWDQYFYSPNADEPEPFQKIDSEVKRGLLVDNADVADNFWVGVPEQNIFYEAPFSFFCEFEYEPELGTAHGFLVNAATDTNSSKSWGLYVDGSTNKLKFQVVDNSGPTFHTIESDGTLQKLTRYKVHVTLDATYNLKMYVNGVLQADFKNSGSMRNENRDFLAMGAVWELGGGFFGRIFDARFWSQNLTQSNVNADLVTPFQDDLVSWWKYDEGTGNTVADSVSGYDGALQTGGSGPSLLKWIESGYRYYWDGSTYAARWSGNPIWCLRDLILNNRYGLGEFVNNDHIDLTYYFTEAMFCESRASNFNDGFEKLFTLDVVIDSSTAAPDLIDQLCSSFRAKRFDEDGKVYLKVLRAESTTRLINMYHILSGPVQTWAEIKDKPNYIEVHFFDKDNNWHAESVVITDADSLNAGKPLVQFMLQLFTSRKTQALRMAQYILNNFKYINRSLGLSTELVSTGIQSCDVVEISDDLPLWGVGAMAGTGSTTEIINFLDPIELPSGVMPFKVQYGNDSIAEGFLSGTAGGIFASVPLLSGTSLTTAPVKYNLINIGTAKKFRVNSYELTNNQFAINLTEYNENLYDESGIVIPENNLSLLNTSVPPITSLKITESLRKRQDGTIENVIEVYWSKPILTTFDVFRYKRALIYLSRDEGTSWELRGETNSTNFEIISTLEELKLYRVAVASASDNIQNHPDASPFQDIYLLGKSKKPENVTNFGVEFDGYTTDLVFTWSPVPDVDALGYEIREGVDWINSRVIAREIPAKSTTFRYQVDRDGDHKYMIRALDSSRNYSNTEAIALITVTSAPETTFYTPVNLLDLATPATGVLLSGVEIISGSTQLPIVDNFGVPVVDNVGAPVYSNVELELYLQTEFDDPNYVTPAGYYSQIVDRGKIERFRLVVTGNFDIRDGTFELWMRKSLDNSTWSDWKAYSVGDFETRYFQIKAIIKLYDPADYGRIMALTAQIVVKHLSETHVVEVGGGGTATLTFDNAYYNQVVVTAIWIGTGGTKYAEAGTLTVDGTGKIISVPINVRNRSDNNLTSGDVSVRVEGY